MPRAGLIRPAVTLLCAGAAAAAMTFIPADAAVAHTGSLGWRVVYATGSKTARPDGWMETVTAVSPADAWAFGSVDSRGAPDVYTPLVRHWNGRSWQTVKLPVGSARALTGFPSTVAAGSSASNVWAFTGGGAWVRFNGHRWTHGELPRVSSAQDAPDITAAAAISSHDVWALGFVNLISPLPYVAHFNGHYWKATRLPLNTAITAVSVLGPGNIWAVGNDTNVLLHWNGHSWKSERVPVRLLAGETFFAGVVAFSPSSVWVTGDVPGHGGALHWNGHSWKTVLLKSAKDPLINATSDGHGGIWAVAQEPGALPGFTPQLWHYTGGHWLLSQIAGASTADFIDQFTTTPGSSSMWAVGLVRVHGDERAAILLHGPAPT